MNPHPARRLIINADGFGLTYGVNLAMFEVAAASAITSISVNSNFQAANQVVLFHATFPRLSIGVHLNPVAGRPVMRAERVRSLLNPDGCFWGPEFLPRLRAGLVRKDELLLEMTAQVEKVLRMGVPVSHLDSHQNSHLHPRFFPVFLKTAKETGVTRMRAPRHRICLECERAGYSSLAHYSTHPWKAVSHFYACCLARIARMNGLKMADRLISVGHGRAARKTDENVWSMIARNLPPGTSEIYCHPGFPNDELRVHASYVDERFKERSVLLSPGFRQLWNSNGIGLISFDRL
jgi:predicted glycoside hydrolase/deacetylase ChbG (UPF0249 family)